MRNFYITRVDFLCQKHIHFGQNIKKMEIDVKMSKIGI